MRRITQEECIKRFVSVHGDKYDYSRVAYVRQKDKVEIGCPDCGQCFMQSPEKHWLGQGCSVCKNDSISRSKTISNVEFLSRCKEKDVDWFDISRVNYKTSRAKALFVCLKCGHENQMKPNSVMSGKGCIECAKRNFGGYTVEALFRNEDKASKPCKLYHVKISRDGEYVCDKIGVTTKTLEHRFHPWKVYGYGYEVIRVINDTLINCVGVESIIKESLLDSGAMLKSNPFPKGVTGWTECFLPLNTPS